MYTNLVETNSLTGGCHEGSLGCTHFPLRLPKMVLAIVPSRLASVNNAVATSAGSKTSADWRSVINTLWRAMCVTLDAGILKLFIAV